MRGIPDIDRQTEDALRTKIDSAVKLMSPKVFPSMYRTSFVHVSDRSGFPIGETIVWRYSFHTFHDYDKAKKTVAFRLTAEAVIILYARPSVYTYLLTEANVMRIRYTTVYVVDIRGD